MQDFYITEECEKRLKTILSEEMVRLVAEYAADQLAARKKYGTFDIDKAVSEAAMRRAYQLGCNDNY